MEEELRDQGKGGCDGQEQEEQQHWTSDTGVAAAGRLIVLDSVSGCLSTAVMDHELGLVRDVAWCLQRLARNYPVAVLLTNSVTSGGTPSLGKQWSHVADIQVMLNVKENDNVIRATLHRHPAKRYHTEPKEYADFVLTTKGVEDPPTM